MVRWRRARGIPLAREDVTENIRVAVPIIDVPDYVEAAETATRERNAGFMTVILEGRYTDAYLAEAGGDSPKFTDDELKTIASPLDFVGINVYKPGWYVEPSAEPPGYRDIPINASHPKMQSWWHVLDPEVMYWAPRQMQSIWGARSPPERRALIWRQSTRSRASRGRTCWHAHRDGRGSPSPGMSRPAFAVRPGTL